MGPRLLAEHFVPLQAGLVGLPEGVTRPPDPHVLQEPEVPDLVAHQGLVENVCSLFFIGLDAPAKENQKGHLALCSPVHVYNYYGEFQVSTIDCSSLSLDIKIFFFFFIYITSPNKFIKSSALGNLPDIVWIFILEIFHQGTN